MVDRELKLICLSTPFLVKWQKKTTVLPEVLLKRFPSGMNKDFFFLFLNGGILNECCHFWFFFLASDFVNLFILFIYFWLCWVFVSVRGLFLVVASGGHSSLRCAGLSLPWPLLLPGTSSRRTGSVVVAHGPSCSAACGVFPDQGSNPRPLH